MNDKEKVLEIIDHVDGKKIIEDELDTQIEKVITSFTDKIHLAKQIIEGEENVLPILPLYYDNTGLWWRWSFGNTKWEIIDEVDLMNHISWSSPANTVNSKERGEILQALKQVSRSNKPKDVPLTWLQFGDEVIDIKTGEREKATHYYFLTNPLPYKIGRSNETPNIDRIFEEWAGKDYVLLLKEVIAYCMLRDYPINRIFCFIGSGMNGKSKYLDLLRKFIGDDNVCSTELDTLLNSRFEVTRLHKKLVCQMGETNFNEMSKTSMLKKLSGGDLINFEYKNKNPFNDLNYAKILIATNNLPTTTDKTVGFYRRWVIIDFPNQFTEKKDILSEIPEDEYNNLANQLIAILMDLTSKREFHKEGSVEERMARYENKSDFLKTFISLFTETDVNGYITFADFNKKFNSWCKENRHREMSETSIGRSLKNMGIEREKKYFDWLFDGKGGQMRCLIGLKWKD
jgi:P4 family phage/plasmid primase-like protien